MNPCRTTPLPPTIPDDHRRDLRVYFEYQAGGRQGAPSSFGAQIERLERFGVQTKKCPQCNGHGFVASKRLQERLKRGVASDKMREYLTLMGLWLNRERLPAFDRICPKCKSWGWVQRKTPLRIRGPLTARPTAECPAPPQQFGGADYMMLLAKVSRQLLAVRAVSPGAVEVLSEYFGPDGGALVSLWHLTPVGKTMLRANSFNLPPQLYFSNIRDQQREKPEPNRGRQFENADTQSQELLDNASEIFCTEAVTKE